MLRPGNEQLVNLRERECSRHRKVQVVNESGKRKLGQAFEGWREVQFRDFLGGSVAKISCCQFRDLGLIPDKGTRSHMLQLKTFSMPQLRPSKDKHTHTLKVQFSIERARARLVRITDPGMDQIMEGPLSRV